MKHLKIFEDYKHFLDKVQTQLKKELFYRLPFEYKKPIVIRYFEVGEDIEWLDRTMKYHKINHGNYPNDWTKDNYFLGQLSREYNEVYGDRFFLYGIVDIEDIKNLVMSSSDMQQYSSFDNYHEWYGSSDLEDTNEIYPILMTPYEDYIEDGWHRFHRYINMGLKEIPVVMFC